MSFLNKLKYNRNSYLITILILAIVIMVNYIAANHFVKIDLTKNKIYEVSEASKTIIKSLDDIVIIKVFFSETLPPNLFVVRQYVEDVLGEFSSYSKGNLSVKFLNPADPTIQQEALGLGIPQVQMNVVEKDKLEVKNGFLGIAITYGNQTEVLPVIKNVLNVEYNLISAIKKVTASKTMTVAFSSGHGEPKLTADLNAFQSPQDSFSLFKQSLSQNYTVSTIDLLKTNALKDIDSDLDEFIKEIKKTLK